MSKYFIISPLLSLLAAFSGCTLAPEYDRPDFVFPDAIQPETGSASSEWPGLNRWWETFNDTNLNDIVEFALSGNADLAIASARIMESRAMLGQSKADLFPTLGLSADASRMDTPDAELSPGQADPANRFALSGLLSYEIDLFGRIRSSNAAARERILSTTYGYYSIKNALVAQIVTLYFQGVALVEQIDLAEQTIKTRLQALDVQEKRYNSGFITQLQLQQTKAELADARVRIPALQELLHTTKTSLHTLTGAEPTLFWDRDSYAFQQSRIPDSPTINPNIAPAALLERRPDIMSAEADLKAAYQSIGIARAQRWPSFSISGLLGTAGNDLDELFTDPTGTWSLAGSMAGPIYDFGRSRNRIRASEARKDQAGWNYRQVVLKAMGEVNDSLAAMQYREDLVLARQEQSDAFDKTLELARLQYEEGYSDYLELLDAERRAFDSRLALVEARFSEITAYIKLCKALGGGWDQAVDEIPVPGFEESILP